MPHLLGHHHRLLLRARGQEHRQLLAAVAERDVGGAHGALHQRRHAAQLGVALGVAPAVVELLEMVEVEQQQAERLALLRGARDLLVQAVLEVPAVEDAGERVGDGLRAEPLLRLLELVVRARERRGGLGQLVAAVPHAAGHLVEGARQVGELVAPVHRQVHVEVAGADALRALGQQQDRPQHPAGQHVREQEDDEHRRDAGAQQAPARLGERLVGALLRDGRRQDAVERLFGQGKDAVDALADAGKDAFLDGRERGGGRSLGREPLSRHGAALACADQDALLPVEQPEVRGSVGGGIGEQPLEVVRVDAGHEIADHPAGALDPVQRQERRPSEPVGGAQRRQHAALARVFLARRLRQRRLPGQRQDRPILQLLLAAADDDLRRPGPRRRATRRAARSASARRRGRPAARREGAPRSACRRPAPRARRRR